MSDYEDEFHDEDASSQASSFVDNDEDDDDGDELTSQSSADTGNNLSGEEDLNDDDQQSNFMEQDQDGNEFLDEDDEDMDDDESYLQKFEKDIKKNYVNDYHPECLLQNYDEVAKLCFVTRDNNNIINDPLHKTLPFLTKYERARVLGQRAKQIESGAIPFIELDPNIIEAHIIAEMELKAKKLPFIIRRPIPGGAFEYWKLIDLELISY